MPSCKATSNGADGPVLALINKRIRNLRKKLKRMTQLEDSIAQGKSIIKNKEQEVFLKSKPTIIAAVDELEKLRQPLSVTVHEEITLALQRRHLAAPENNDNDEDCNKPQALDSPVRDLLSLIYVGSLFDPKPASDFDSIKHRAVHEGKSCLMYDYFTRQFSSSVILVDEDLDMMGRLASLLTSRPEGCSDTHQNALQRCTEHANRWLSRSKEQIVPESSITYADLREKLEKVMGLDYMVNHPDADVTDAVAKKFGLPKGSLTGFVHELGDEVKEYELTKSEEEESKTWPFKYPEGEVIFPEDWYATESKKIEEAEKAQTIKLNVEAESCDEGNGNGFIDYEYIEYYACQDSDFEEEQEEWRPNWWRVNPHHPLA